MLRKMSNLMAIVAVFSMASIATADDTKSCAQKCSKEAKAACSKGDKAKCAEAGLANPNCCGSDVIAKYKLDVPAMKYKVGDKTVCCPGEATELVKATKDAKMMYVVGEKSYECEMEAKKAYATELNSYLDNMMSVKYAVGDECTHCPMTAKDMAKKCGKDVKYRVSAFDFNNQESADEAVKHAKTAVEKVHLVNRVGDKETTCCQTAAKMAKEEGKPVEYCVGKTKTECEVTAGVNLALAKIEAAVAALAKDAAPASANAGA